ncbi:hypothetical protein HN011_011092 [Eciton burchellii]|nr:hypothetical protein HN011_011092 [Eciton burchellii]
MVSVIKVFTITIPQKNDLCCAIYKIVNCENDPMIYSRFCENKLKCRACLFHTMECKLAPRWNRVGLYLVEGQDFLGSTGSVNAIRLKIKEIHDNNAVLHVNAVNLKIPFLRLNTAHHLQPNLLPPVRVLPSMKMANVLRISKIIKSQEVSDDYDNLRAYWKNMHGYILPDYEEGFLFYDIKFFYFKSSIFLYPEMCLTSGPLEILSPPMDPISRIYKFAEELKERVIELCGQQLDIYLENVYQTAVVPCTPISSRTNRFSICDTGYNTRSERIQSMNRSQAYDTCEIPTKRSRLSLSKTNEPYTCGTEVDDYDFGISPMRSTNEFKSLKTPDNIPNISNADTSVFDKSIVEDERKSPYFTEEGEKIEVKSAELTMDKEKKPVNLTLREKLLRNF